MRDLPTGVRTPPAAFGDVVKSAAQKLGLDITVTRAIDTAKIAIAG